MNKFLIGLILGIVIAGGLAIYLNGAPTQFMALKGVNSAASNAPTNANPSAKPVLLAPGTKSQQINASNTDASGTNYEFYDVLQGKKVSSKTANTVTPQSSSVRITSSDAVEGILDGGIQSHKLFVQAGAFANSSRAHDMQSRLLFMGIKSSIRDGQGNNKVVHRVLIGPIDTSTQAQQIINQLFDQKINAVLVK